MDFDFLWKMICTISFASVSLCLCIKWVVESYLDYIQVTTGIKVITLAAIKEKEGQERDIHDDPTAY